MWQPWRLTTLWDSTACYRDSFTFFYMHCLTPCFCYPMITCGSSTRDAHSSLSFASISLFSASINFRHMCKRAKSRHLLFFFTGSTAPLGPGLCFQLHDHLTDGRTPWRSDQLVARPLPKHRVTQTQNKHIRTANIHALCWIQTHDPSFRASEDSSYLRPLGYRDRPPSGLHYKNF
jgi:hypothetical protein